MNTVQKILVVIAGLVLASCSSFAPVSVTGGEQCFRCRRTIVDARLAGEVIDGNGFVAKFRAPGCLAKYLAAHPEETGIVYVTDYATGKMIAAERATFVPLLVNRDRGEYDYHAYRLKADADAAARQVRSAPVEWTTVLANARS
jgi:hypothetical protein